MSKTLCVPVLAAAIAVVAAFRPGAAEPTQQEIDVLRGADAPPNAIWIDSLDLSKMVQRRQTPRAGDAGARARRPWRGCASGPTGGTRRRSGCDADHTRRRRVSPRHRHALDQRAHHRSQRAGHAVRVDGRSRRSTRRARRRSPSKSGWTTRRSSISGVLHAGDPPKFVDIDLTGARFLELFIDDGGRHRAMVTTRTGAAA